MGITIINPRTFAPHRVRIMRDKLGSAIIGQTFGVDSPSNVSGGAALSDAQQVTTAVEAFYDESCTGIKWYQSTQGNFTGDQFNGFALYSISAGTLTQIAITTNDANHWKNAQGWVTTPWVTPADVEAAELYFVALLYNQSAATTPPSIGNSAVGISGSVVADFSNSVKLNSTWGARTTLASSIAMTSLTQSTLRPYFMLYN